MNFIEVDNKEDYAGLVQAYESFYLDPRIDN